MTTPHIHPARSEDLAATTALFLTQHQEHNIPRTAEELEAGLRLLQEKPELGFVLTATFEGKVVGVTYTAAHLSLEHGGMSGWLEDIYIAPEWRGKGLGSELLKAVIAAAEERGWKALDLEVDTDHQRAIPLYQRHGFEPVRRSHFVRRFGGG